MKLYLDTEFNGHGGELISMALVSGARDWYAWIEQDGETLNPWVKEHVMPVIWLRTGFACRDKADFRASFHRFIQQFDNPEVICDWHADAAHFCDMLQGPDYGSSLDFACRITILKTPPGQPISRLPHNALEDAYALMRWHQEQP